MMIKKPRILVVDDEESMVFSIQDYLSSYADCMGATNYEEALTILQQDEGILLVISDIRMPGKDGFDLLMWLREHRPQVKVVMMTAYGSPSVRALAKQKGAVLYLEKPLDLEQLMVLVKQAVERKGFFVALQDMELADVLQFLSFSGKAAKVLVTNALGEQGEIDLEGEEIFWIRTDTKVKEEAFYEIMSWEGGKFDVYPLDTKKKPPREKLSVPLSFLLLENARIRDEATVKQEKVSADIVLRHEDAMSVDIVEVLAAWKKNVSGFVETAIINMDGTFIAGISNKPGEDLSLPAAYCAKSMKTIIENLRVNDRGECKEVLVTTDSHHMIFQKFNADFFLALTVTTDEGNLGISRLQVEQLSKKVRKELELEESHL
jgi:CheY-like chemotaxis protein/predicted regulator of Ras-like GTPase activity (Roadblock/LC7/MglB family)